MNISIGTDIEYQIYKHLQNITPETGEELLAIVRPALREDIKHLKELLSRIAKNGDQEIILEELKRDNTDIKRIYSTSREKIENESQTLKEFRQELSTIALSENIAYLKALTNTTPKNYKKLINDAIHYLFMKFEDAQAVSKCDVGIIRAIIGDYTHYLVRHLYSVTHYEDYKSDSEKFQELNAIVGDLFEESKDILLKATREKDDNLKSGYMLIYVEITARIDIYMEKWAELQNAMYGKAFRGMNINTKIERFMRKLNPLIPIEEIPVITEASMQAELEGSDPFYRIHQGIGTNKLMTTKGKVSGLQQIDPFGVATIETEDFKLIMESYSEKTGGLSISTKMLLDALVIKFTETGNPRVVIPLREYAQMREKGIKEMREQALRDMDLLKKIKINYLEKIRGDYKPSGDISLYGGTGIIENGKIIFTLNPDFFRIIAGYPIMPYPKDILKYNAKRNPYSYNLHRKISEHKNMNYGKKTADTISVKTLLEACADMPKYDDLGEQGQARQRIIDPFERDMNNIKDIEWEYCGKNGKPIDYPERYSDFIKANIRIKWITPYPERKELQKIPKTEKRKKIGG